MAVTTQQMIPSGLTDCLKVYAEAGFATFPTRNKVPLKGVRWKESMVDDAPVPLKYPYGQFGVRLKPDDLIIDIDPRNMKGREVWSELKTQISTLREVEKQATIVRTTSGGLHLYLRKPPQFPIRKSLKRFPGLDFLSEGAYVIGAGSMGEERLYEFLTPPFIPVEAPRGLLSLIRKEENIIDAGVAQVQHQGFADTPENVQRYEEYLEGASVAVEGEMGDTTTYKIACRGREYNLTAKQTWESMRKDWNKRCKPPWDETSLLQKVRNAYVYDSEMPGKQDPKQVFAGVDPPPDSAMQDPAEIFDVYSNKNRTPKPTLKNAETMLRIEVGIAGKFSWNEFTGRLDIIGNVPWEDERINMFREVNDLEVDKIRLYLAHKFKMNKEYSSPTMWSAIQVVAANNSHHPVRKHIKSLEWDGVPRLNSWLVDYCGAEDNELTRQIGRKFLMAMIARVFDPGIKWDFVLVLEGAQGIGKSTLCRTLGGEWFGDAPIDPKDKDCIPYIHSHWVIELSEMVVTRKTQSDRLKNFLSRTEDDIRMPYARARTRFPRQCVFVGTVNPDDVGYLYDSTGNRRFWCVYCSDIKYEDFADVRDQLIAEAYQAYLKTEPLIMPRHLLDQAEESSNRRLADHPWIGLIKDWSDANPDIAETTTTEVYSEVLLGQVRVMNTAHQRIIAEGLNRAGWSKLGINGSNKYVRPVKKDPFQCE